MNFGDILQRDKDGNVTLFYIGFSDGKYLAWSVFENKAVSFIPNFTLYEGLSEVFDYINENGIMVAIVRYNRPR